uniref:Uncharacterized protein n=1 Tax=Glossina palpalis gambiensis TaxID=67801 RepID=A0A1B0AX96_9MUSC
SVKFCCCLLPFTNSLTKCNSLVRSISLAVRKVEVTVFNGVVAAIIVSSLPLLLPCFVVVIIVVSAVFKSCLVNNGVTVSTGDVSVSVAVSAVIKSSIVVVAVVACAGINSTGSTFDFFKSLYGSFSCPGINSFLSPFDVVVAISTELDSKFVVFMLTLRIQSVFFLYLPPISASLSINIEGRVVISSTSKFKEKPSLLTCTCSVVSDEFNVFSPCAMIVE